MVMNKQRKISIGILIAIILVIAGIYFVKNAGPRSAATTDAKMGGLIDPAGDISLPLHAKSIDLEELKKQGIPIMIDFGSDTCGPCITMAPFLETIHNEFEGKAIVQFVNTELYPDIAANFPLTVIPTQFFFNADGTPYTPSEDIGFEFIMYEAEDTGEHAFTVHQGLLTVEEMRIILADMGASV